MIQVDNWFESFARANPTHRFRVGNPDEMRSNRMNKTLDFLQHRVVAPEPGVTEALTGGVITALNEEAVVSAALANKQGINLVVSYEAFAVKMLGAMRQEAIFARHFVEAGRPLDWLSVPVIVTSHTWENGKNEQSHQDPTLCEAWLGEMSDVAPVVFPIDANTAVAALRKLFRETGRIATLVIPKGSVKVLLSGGDARTAVEQGIVLLKNEPGADIQLVGIGAYQVGECLRAARVLAEKQVKCSVAALLEPGRFRVPRDAVEATCVHTGDNLQQLLPAARYRVFVSHTRADVMFGVLRKLTGGADSSRILGYANRGGTLDTFGMQYANGQTWAHVLQAVSELVAGLSLDTLLHPEQLSALAGHSDPERLR